MGLQVEQVERELAIMYQLQDVGYVVRLLNHFEDKEHLILVMEYLEGGSLRGALTGSERMGRGKIEAILRQTLLAIDGLHTKGIIHRDVKPENVLLDTQGTIKLVDFGISNFSADEGRTTEVFTNEYLSPEMVAGHQQDHRLDLWAYGVMLYEAILGHTPFSIPQQQAISMNVLQQRQHFIDIIRSHNNIPFPQNVPVLFKDLIVRILKREPEERLNVQEILSHRWWQSTSLTRQITKQPSLISNILNKYSSIPSLDSFDIQDFTRLKLVTNYQTDSKASLIQYEANFQLNESRINQLQQLYSHLTRSSSNHQLSSQIQQEQLNYQQLNEQMDQLKQSQQENIQQQEQMHQLQLKINKYQEHNQKAELLINEQMQYVEILQKSEISIVDDYASNNAIANQDIGKKIQDIEDQLKNIQEECDKIKSEKNTLFKDLIKQNQIDAEIVQLKSQKDQEIYSKKYEELKEDNIKQFETEIESIFKQSTQQIKMQNLENDLDQQLQFYNRIDQNQELLINECDNFIMTIRESLPDFDTQIEQRKSCVNSLYSSLTRLNTTKEENIQKRKDSSKNFLGFCRK